MSVAFALFAILEQTCDAQDKDSIDTYMGY